MNLIEQKRTSLDHIDVAGSDRIKGSGAYSYRHEFQTTAHGGNAMTTP
ncbi:hypothetical protein [Bifidobacterium callimiconis]